MNRGRMAPSRVLCRRSLSLKGKTRSGFFLVNFISKLVMIPPDESPGMEMEQDS